MSWWSADVLDRKRWQPLVESVLDRAVRALEAERFPHALMLVGPQGLGRELAAVELAVMLACGDAARPWMDCVCAARVREGLHPDVEAVLPSGAAAQIKIDPIRAIVDSAPGRPYEGQHRVWILDGVEAARFGPGAANAFLKVLEEPPDHVRFLLLAANPDSVLPTIRSRCQQLSLPGPAAIAKRLGVEAPPALVLAELAGEGVRPDVERARAVLADALAGEVRDVLRLPLLLADDPPPTEIVAVAAIEEAADAEDGSRAADLVRLAGDLVAVEQRVRSLRLTRDRQLVSCLLRWWRELPVDPR